MTSTAKKIFDRKLILWLIGVSLVLTPFAGTAQANSANVAATVTVVPRVEAVTAQAIPVGSSSIYPQQRLVTVLALSILNTYTEQKALTLFTVRDASTGLGSRTQLLSNVDSVFLFLDIDRDSLLSAGDSLLAAALWDAANKTMTLSNLPIAPDSTVVLLVSVNAALFPRDGDTVDVFLRPSSDIRTADATPVTGSEPLNSMGVRIFDGLVAAQLNTISTGLTGIGTGDTVYNVFTVDIPRNGYAVDTLRSFTIHNAGTADRTDLEFMVLFLDNGNGIWGGFSEETLVAPLEYTGAHWSVSNLQIPLTALTTRFYLATKTLPYPTNGATIILNIPEYGILVASRNDGPLDGETQPVDTITIQCEEGLLATSLPLSSASLIPGDLSQPIFAFRLRNGNRDAIQLDSLDLTLELVDPTGQGSLPEVESQFDSVVVYVDGDGDPTTISPSDIAIASSSATIGKCRFRISELVVEGSGGEISLSAVLATNLAFARNGNTADMSLEGETDIFVQPGTNYFGSFPLTTSSVFTVDAFPSEKVIVNNLSPRNLYGGQSNIPLLDFVAPGDGYAADTLMSLAIRNVGTVEDDVAVAAMKLWHDRLGDGFTVDDILVTNLSRGALSWTATGFSQPVPSVGGRLIVTVDIFDQQFDGGTLALAIPVGGMTYRSGMSGPDDESIVDGSTHLIVPPQRITVVSVPSTSTTVRPAQTKNTLLTFAAYNGYINETETLQMLRFTNISRSASDINFADYEIGRLRLYYDADANRLLSGDPLIGAGYFQDGVLTMTNLNLTLPPESLAYFFVQSDLTVSAIDSDSLGISIGGIADIGFQESVSINGDLPLTSGGWHIVDGSVKCQYDVLPLASQSVSPSELLVPLMAFRPAANGDQIDTLVSVSVVNLGTADTSDIANLKLWRDSNGDDIWQVSDVLIGNLTYSGSSWGTGGFDLPVALPQATLFVTGDVQSSAAVGRTVNLSVPLMGCLYRSGNDGPIDSTLMSGAQFSVAGSNLAISRTPGVNRYSVGETIVIEFSASNLSETVMDSVMGICELIGEPSLVRLDSTSCGPVAVASSDSAIFTCYYTAMQPGIFIWSLRAVELATGDSSSWLTTESYQIQTAPTGVDVGFVSSMPATVTLGQKNIIPLSLTFSHKDTALSVAAVVLDSLRLRVVSGASAPLSAADVFARMRLISDDMYVTELSEIPSLSDVTFIFAHPLVVLPGAQRSLSAIIDIDTGATASDFALTIVDAAFVIFRDNNSGVEVPVSASPDYPLMTTTARIERPPDRLLVAALSQVDQTFNLGQGDTQWLRLSLRHPGLSGTAPIQFTELSVAMEDDLLQPVIFSQVVEALKVVQRGNVTVALTGTSLNSESVKLTLSSPPILGPGESDTLDLLLDIRSDGSLKRLRLSIADSTLLLARNYSTGESVPVSLDLEVMPPESVFPLNSGWVQLRYPAQAPLVCFSSTPNLAILAGTDNVTLASVVLNYPATEEFSPLRLLNLSVTILDSTSLALDPRLLFDRLGYAIDSSATQYQASVNPINGQTVFDFGPEGILINPSDSITVRLIADLDAGVPYDHFLLRVGSLSALQLVDGIDSSLHLTASVSPECASAVPFVSEPITILWPAGRPILQPDSPILALATAGQRDVQIFDAYLNYASQVPRGDLLLQSLTASIFSRTGDVLTPVSGASVFASARLLIDDDIWAVDSSLAASTTLLWSSNEYRLPVNSEVRVQLEVDIRTDARLGNYVMTFTDSTFMRFVDEHVDTALYVILASGSYPLKSTELSVSAADLNGSFTNFPNPFIPSRGEGKTTFGYFLAEDAFVSIDLYTTTGELVTRLVKNIRKAAGNHDEDTWDGHNDRGLPVAPGAYLCVITASYDSGRQESARRKVAVVR